MGTVMGGVSYGLYFVAKVHPLSFLPSKNINLNHSAISTQ